MGGLAKSTAQHLLPTSRESRKKVAFAVLIFTNSWERLREERDPGRTESD